MSVPIMHDDGDSHRYLRDLAASLVADLGIDAALETCRSYGWDGVWGVLVTQRNFAPAGPVGQRHMPGGLQRGGHK